MNQPKDITGQLVEYIKKNLAKGYNQDTLRFSLMSQGYSKITVENAIERAHKQLSETLPAIKEKPQITYKVITEDNTETITTMPLKKKPWWRTLFE